VVNLEAFRTLPGVNIIPFSGNRAFLALDPGRGMSDLELAAIDRLGDPAIEARERRALMTLRTQLTAWRRDDHVTYHTRAIIVIERLKTTPAEEPGGEMGTRARGPASKRPVRPSAGPRELKNWAAGERRPETAGRLSARPPVVAAS
jgi:hypothetical protein